MKKLKKNIFFKVAALCVLICLSFPVAAQSSDSLNIGFDMSGSPQWAKDLRRGEIVAFGSFPFTFFLTTFTIDSIRTVNNNWDMRYAPWPFKVAGAVPMSQEEMLISIGIAAGASAIIALVDYFIVRGQRNKKAEEIRNLAPGTPIIIRRPIDEESELPNILPETESESD